MKKILFILFVILGCVSCDSEKKETTPSEPSKEIDSFSFSQSSVTVGAESTSVDITVTSSGNWTIAGATDWCAVSPSSGAKGSIPVKLTFSANTTSNEKSVTLTGKCGTASATLKVAQKEKSALTLTSDKVEVNQDGGEIVVEVKTNVDLDVEIPAQSSWIKYLSTKAMQTKKLSFSIEQNTQYDKREGQIIIKDKAGSLADTVFVYQAQKEAIVLSQNGYNVPAAGGQVTIEIKTNVDFEVNMPDDKWVHLISTKALTSHTLLFEVDENKSYDARTASIVVRDKNSKLQETITIKQFPVEALFIKTTEYAVDAEESILAVAYESNLESVQYKTKVDWISGISTKGIVADTLYFAIAANPEYEDRVGEVEITNEAGDLSCTITVTQKTKIGLFWAEDTVSVAWNTLYTQLLVQANTPFTTVVSSEAANWLQIAGTKSLSNYVVDVVLANNMSLEPREGIIYLKDGNDVNCDNLVFIQTGFEGFNLTPELITLSCQNQASAEVQVIASCDWSLEGIPEWLSVSPMSGTRGTQILKLTANENDRYQKRNASIQVKGSAHMAQFEVIQEGAPAPENGIKNAAELMAFRDAVNKNQPLDAWKDKNGVINLIANIDLAGQGNWTPIGSFKGVFDGNGYEIHNLKVSGDRMYTGLFGYVSGAVIRNVVIAKDCSFSSTYSYYSLPSVVGTICGECSNTTIEGCVNYSSDLTGEMIGGICGWIREDSKVINCVNESAIYWNSSSDKTDFRSLGGISGVSSSSSIVKCINRGDLMGRTGTVGGICGQSEGTADITDCINYGAVIQRNSQSSDKPSSGGICGVTVGSKIAKSINYGNVEGTLYTGGVCGFFTGNGDSGYSQLKGSINEGKIVGQGTYTGGIVALNYCGKVEECTNKGIVEGNTFASGVCANNSGQSTMSAVLDNCSNSAKILASSCAGGICGENENEGRVLNSSNSGEIVSMGPIAGGVCGYNYLLGTVYNCTNSGKLSSTNVTGDIIGYQSTSSSVAAASKAKEAYSIASQIKSGL